MGANSAIQWCHHTFNPWRGCTHVSPGCENCYAETLSKRNPGTLGTWGAGGARVVASESYWRQPLRWNAAAEAAGERHRVFCASLADVFEDRPDLVYPRLRLFELIERTPWLDWLLLTKRPQNAGRWFMPLYPETDPWPWLPNVWLGTSVEDQRRAEERVPALMAVPAAVRFLSCEPLIGPVDLAGVWGYPGSATREQLDRWPIDWLIVGGESGASARPMDLAWARSLVEQCRDAEVAPFVKQLGRRPVAELRDHEEPEAAGWPPWTEWGVDQFGDPAVRLRDAHGGDWGEWPNDLRIREWPASAVRA